MRPLFYVFDADDRAHGTMCEEDDVAETLAKQRAILSSCGVGVMAIRVWRIEPDEIAREVHTEFLPEDLGEARPAFGSRLRSEERV